MERIILLTANNLYSILILIISMIFFIFILKKYTKDTKKILKYLYFIYFIVIFRVLIRSSDVFDSKKAIGLFYLILSFSIIRVVDLVFKQFIIKNKRKKEIPQLILNLFTFVIFIISFLYILRNYYGVNLTSLLTTSAILSAVIGLALQDTLTTFIAGLILTTDSSMEIGDTVEVGDIIGKVADTNWYSTKLQKLGGGVINIPNNIFLKSITSNYYKKTNIILRIKVSCSYSDPPNKVRDTLLCIAAANNKILQNPEPYVAILAFGDFSIDYELRIWVYEEYLRRARIETELYSAIWYAFKREGIKIPFPTREILRPRDLEDKSHKIEKSYLKNVEFFKNLSNEDIEKLIDISQIRMYGKDEYVFFQGDKGDSFFLIKSGNVSIIIDNREITTLSKGEFFGEMSLLTGKLRSASVRALVDIEVIVIDKKSFKEVIQENKVLFESVLNYLTKREEENIIFRKEMSKDAELNKNYKEKIKKNMFNKLIKFFEL